MESLYALAQLEGVVGSGPAGGLSDPVVLRLGQSVDLGSGFVLEVGGRGLFSAAAVDPGGQTVGVPLLDVGRAVCGLAGLEQCLGVVEVQGG